MKQLLISIPGIPLAKKRHRTVALLQCTGCQRKLQGQYKECPHCNGSLRFLTNLSYSDSESVKYENLISYCSQQAMQTAGVSAFTGPTRMRMTFLFPIPESRKCKKHPDGIIKGCDMPPYHPDPGTLCKKLHPGDHHTQRPDVDNCVKSILDGGNKILFADDCIIVELSAKKQWAAEGRAEILVEEL